MNALKTSGRFSVIVSAAPSRLVSTSSTRPTLPHVRIRGMGDYTITNIKDVKDSAQEFGLSPGLEARFPSGDLGTTKTGMSYQHRARVPSAVRPAIPSRRSSTSSSAAPRIKLEDADQGRDAVGRVRIPAGRMHDIEAGDDGLEVLAFGAHPVPLRARRDGAGLVVGLS